MQRVCLSIFLSICLVLSGYAAEEKSECTCGKHYSNDSQLGYHLTAKSQGYIHHCRTCGQRHLYQKNWRTHFSTNRHEELGQGEKFFCHYCRKRSSNERTPFPHFYPNDDDETFEEKFDSEQQLETHVLATHFRRHPDFTNLILPIRASLGNWDPTLHKKVENSLDFAIVLSAADSSGSYIPDPDYDDTAVITSIDWTKWE